MTHKFRGKIYNVRKYIFEYKKKDIPIKTFDSFILKIVSLVFNVLKAFYGIGYQHNLAVSNKTRKIYYTTPKLQV